MQGCPLPTDTMFGFPAGLGLPTTLLTDQFHGEVKCQCQYICPKRKGGGGKQGMAARERRRKITAKTQELGKLIPGAHKMNTAQMLQAASKYVKFLQAQLALLQEMASFGHEAEEMEALLTSPAIQEKLYSEDKCLAPGHFLQKFASISKSFDDSLHIQEC